MLLNFSLSNFCVSQFFLHSSFFSKSFVNQFLFFNFFSSKFQKLTSNVIFSLENNPSIKFQSSLFNKILSSPIYIQKLTIVTNTMVFSSTVTVLDSIFLNIQSNQIGGGISMYTSNSILLVCNCQFINLSSKSHTIQLFGGTSISTHGSAIFFKGLSSNLTKICFLDCKNTLVMIKTGKSFYNFIHITSSYSSLGLYVNDYQGNCDYQNCNISKGYQGIYANYEPNPFKVQFFQAYNHSYRCLYMATSTSGSSSLNYANIIFNKNEIFGFWKSTHYCNNCIFYYCLGSFGIYQNANFIFTNSYSNTLINSQIITTNNLIFHSLNLISSCQIFIKTDIKLKFSIKLLILFIKVLY